MFTSCKTIDWKSQEITTRIDKKGDLIGIVNKQSFQKNTYLEWDNSHYETDKKIISKLMPLLKNVKIIIFTGTWCDDSKREVPFFYKILEETKFDTKNLKMVALNRKKKANGLQRGYNIKKIPTFIIYHNDKEIGRIVESAIDDSSLEQDLLSIVLKGYSYDYQNNY